MVDGVAVVVGVAVQRADLELHLHARRARSAASTPVGHLAEHDQALGLELDGGERVRLERVRRRERRRRGVAVLGVAPDLAPSRQRRRLELVAVARRVRAPGGPGREHVGRALHALRTDQVRLLVVAVGGGGEPPFHRGHPHTF